MKKKKKKGKEKRRKIELIRLRQGSFIIKRGSFACFMCKVLFLILFIWVCLIISITLDLVLRQFRFSLRVFNLNSRFFLRDYVKAVLYYFVSLWSFLSLCLDSLHVLYSIAGFRFCQRSKYKHVRYCDCNFNLIVQFNIIILCKYPKINMHMLHTVLDIFPMVLTRRIC